VAVIGEIPLSDAISDKLEFSIESLPPIYFKFDFFKKDFQVWVVVNFKVLS